MRMIFRVMMATLVLVLPTTLPSAQEAEQQAILKTLQQVRANFRSADEDGDDRITRNQFRSFVDANAEIAFGMSKQIKRMRAYRRAFNTLDSDGDDILTWQEYVEALRNRGGQG